MSGIYFVFHDWPSECEAGKRPLPTLARRFALLFPPFSSGDIPQVLGAIGCTEVFGTLDSFSFQLNVTHYRRSIHLQQSAGSRLSSRARAAYTCPRASQNLLDIDPASYSYKSL